MRIPKTSNIISGVLALGAMITLLLLGNRFLLGTNALPEPPDQITDAEWERLDTEGHLIGPEDAPVRVAFFSDLACPFSREAFNFLINEVDTHNGKFAFYYRHLTWQNETSPGFEAALAAECASAHERFNQFLRTVYGQGRSQQNFDWIDIAEQAGISEIAAFEKCRMSQEKIERVTQDVELAHELKFISTPTIVANRNVYTGGEALTQVDDYISEQMTTSPDSEPHNTERDTFSATLREVSRVPDVLPDRIRDAAVADDTTIYVAGTRQLHVLSSDGTLEKELGGNGSNVQFDRLASVQVIEHERVTVFDARSKQFLQWTPAIDHQPQDISYIPVESSKTVKTGYQLNEDYFLIAHEQPYGPGYPEDDSPARRSIVDLVNAEGQIVRDSAIVLPQNDYLVLGSSDRVVVSSQFPFRHVNHFRVNDRGKLYHTWGREPVLNAFSERLRDHKSYPLSYTAPPITAQQAMRETKNLPDAARGPVLEQRPERWPAISRMLLNNVSDQLWVASNSGSGQIHWRVYETDGTYVGSTALPEDLKLFSIHDTRAYGTSTGDDSGALIVYDIQFNH